MKKIVISCIFVVFIMLLLPVSSAVSPTVQTNKKTIDIEEFIDTVLETLEDKPELQQRFIEIMGIENVNGFNKEEIKEELLSKLQSEGSVAGNIWYFIMLYRFVRFSASYFIIQPFLLNLIENPFLRKLIVLRTAHWGLKLARAYMIGSLLGFNIPDYAPYIHFVKDVENKTLTVNRIFSFNVDWSDINQSNSPLGNCDPLPTGRVKLGDEITNCTGIIRLEYVPTGAEIGRWGFPE